jgi:hypothetical protein
MTLKKVDSEESKRILQQWVKTTIEERQKFEVTLKKIICMHRASRFGLLISDFDTL